MAFIPNIPPVGKKIVNTNLSGSLSSRILSTALANNIGLAKNPEIGKVIDSSLKSYKKFCGDYGINEFTDFVIPAALYSSKSTAEVKLKCTKVIKIAQDCKAKEISAKLRSAGLKIAGFNGLVRTGLEKCSLYREETKKGYTDTFDEIMKSLERNYGDLYSYFPMMRNMEKLIEFQTVLSSYNINMETLFRYSAAYMDKERASFVLDHIKNNILPNLPRGAYYYSRDICLVINFAICSKRLKSNEDATAFLSTVLCADKTIAPYDKKDPDFTFTESFLCNCLAHESPTFEDIFIRSGGNTEQIKTMLCLMPVFISTANQFFADSLVNNKKFSIFNHFAEMSDDVFEGVIKELRQLFFEALKEIPNANKISANNIEKYFLVFVKMNKIRVAEISSEIHGYNKWDADPDQISFDDLSEKYSEELESKGNFQKALINDGQDLKKALAGSGMNIEPFWTINSPSGKVPMASIIKRIPEVLAGKDNQINNFNVMIAQMTGRKISEVRDGDISDLMDPIIAKELHEKLSKVPDLEEKELMDNLGQHLLKYDNGDAPFSFLKRNENDLLLGKTFGDCTAPGGIHYEDFQGWVQSPAFQMVVLNANKAPAVKVGLALVKNMSDGKFWLLIDSTEVTPKYREQSDETNRLMPDMIRWINGLAKRMGIKDIAINATSNTENVKEFYNTEYFYSKKPLHENKFGFSGKTIKASVFERIDKNINIQTALWPDITNNYHTLYHIHVGD